MLFKKAGIPRPTEAQIAELYTPETDHYPIITKEDEGNVYYTPTYDRLLFFDKSNNVDYHYYFDNHESGKSGWYIVVGGTEIVCVDDMIYDEADATIYSLSYLTAIVEKAVLSINLTTTKKIQLKTEGKYCYNDFLIVPKLQEKTIIENGEVEPDSGYSGLGKVIVNVKNNDIVLQEKTATENGEVLPDEGYDGLSKVEVAVPESKPTLQKKTATPTEKTQTISPDTGYDGLSLVTVNAVPTESKTVTVNGTYKPSSGKFLNSVTVEVEQGVFPSGTLEVTQNGEYDVTQKQGVNVNVEQGVFPSGTLEINKNGEQDVTNYEAVNVNVEPTLQEKTATPTTSAQTISADNGYDGLSKVTIKEVSLQEKTVSPSVIEQIVSPDADHIGLSNVTVEAVPTETKSTTENGIVTPSDGKFLSSVEVNVQPPLQAKIVSPTAEGNGLLVLPDDEYYGLKQVNVTPIKTEQKTITENGAYTPTNGFFFNLVNVEVDDMPKLTTQTISIAELDAGIYIWDYPDGEKTLDYYSGTRQIYQNPTLLQVSAIAGQKDFYLLDDAYGADESMQELIWGAMYINDENGEVDEGFCLSRFLYNIPVEKISASNFVEVTGSQVIRGDKTFTGYTTFSNAPTIGNSKAATLEDLQTKVSTSDDVMWEGDHSFTCNVDFTDANVTGLNGLSKTKVTLAQLRTILASYSSYLGKILQIVYTGTNSTVKTILDHVGTLHTINSASISIRIGSTTASESALYGTNDQLLITNSSAYVIRSSWDYDIANVITNITDGTLYNITDTDYEFYIIGE